MPFDSDCFSFYFLLEYWCWKYSTKWAIIEFKALELMIKIDIRILRDVYFYVCSMKFKMLTPLTKQKQCIQAVIIVRAKMQTKRIESEVDHFRVCFKSKSKTLQVQVFHIWVQQTKGDLLISKSRIIHLPQEEKSLHEFIMVVILLTFLLMRSKFKCKFFSHSHSISHRCKFRLNLKKLTTAKRSQLTSLM